MSSLNPLPSVITFFSDTSLLSGRGKVMEFKLYAVRTKMDTAFLCSSVSCSYPFVTLIPKQQLFPFQGKISCHEFSRVPCSIGCFSRRVHPGLRIGFSSRRRSFFVSGSAFGSNEGLFLRDGTFKLPVTLLLVIFWMLSRTFSGNIGYVFFF